MADRLILDLDKLQERDTVRFRGVAYGLRNTEEVSIFDLSAAGRKMAHVQAQLGTDLTPEAEDECRRIVDELATLVLDAPPGIIAALDVAQKMRIVRAFFDRSPQGSEPAADPSIGENSSPDSPASTAEIPSPGCTESPAES